MRAFEERGIEIVAITGTSIGGVIGGLYACGYAITFAYLEVRTVAGEISESASIGEFIQEQLVEFIFRFALDSLANLIQALMWPVYMVQYRPPVGAIALGIAFVVFPMSRHYFLKLDLLLRR